jgi:hypothetical protein
VPRTGKTASPKCVASLWRFGVEDDVRMGENSERGLDDSVFFKPEKGERGGGPLGMAKWRRSRRGGGGSDAWRRETVREQRPWPTAGRHNKGARTRGSPVVLGRSKRNRTIFHLFKKKNSNGLN